MASIRRTLSPIPRPGAIQNGETHSVPSPLSKSSSHSQNHLESGGLLSTVFGSMDSHPLLYRIQTIVLNILSHRSSRPLERSKSKGPFLRRSFIHFFICFVVGIFFGLTPFLSTSFPINLVSKYQTFSFDVTPAPVVIEYHRDRFENFVLKTNASVETENLVLKTTVSQPSVQDTVLNYRTLLIIVTPTYARPFQAYYLNRLAHTLRLVPAPLLWIVIEISMQSVETADILRRAGVMYRHLVCDKNITSSKDRGVGQRNVALSHIEKHRLDGIVYFADADNVYSVELFEQMREIRLSPILKEISPPLHDSAHALVLFSRRIDLGNISHRMYDTKDKTFFCKRRENVRPFFLTPDTLRLVFGIKAFKHVELYCNSVYILTKSLPGVIGISTYFSVLFLNLKIHDSCAVLDPRRLGTWLVAMLAKSKNRVVLEGPVCNGTQINGWHTNDRSKRMRRFHADMSGFAFNSTILWDPSRWHRHTLEPIRQLNTVKEGFQESTFIEQVVEDESQMEGLVDCSRILLWHLHLEASHPFYPQNWLTKKSLDVIEPLT
ncbi:hypothetical protein GIB67_025287 [Kingdonia uniflora]|uniref:Glycosyltransferases n=1 Tax=Kingdonia uniflora TaxID=39325 RepID=A0A7J7NB40_9MAGN|nr:hypothetical protein GIB67_025287 [Kingdonia uniflora]